MSEPARRLVTANRRQLIWTNVDVERLIGEDHCARAIWEFVGRLDLSAYESIIKSVEGSAGRPAYDPRLLISIWILATSMGEGSAREIERLCGFHPAFQWLTGLQVISHRTLSDFRVDHKEKLDELFTQVLGLLSAENLITLERVTQDGTKIKACASGNSFRREEKLRAHLALAREQVAAMGDPKSDGNARGAAKVRALRDREGRLQRALEELTKIQGEKTSEKARSSVRASETDPEARNMRQGNGGFAAAYNVQLTVDAAHGIIVNAAVSQSSADFDELEGAMRKVEDRTGRKPGQVIADGGYTTNANIMAMLEAGIDFVGSYPDTLGSMAARKKRLAVAPGFGVESFSYDEAKDKYVCPGGQDLRLIRTDTRDPGAVYYEYRARIKACAICPHQKDCHPRMKSEGRAIVRAVRLPAIAAFRERMATEEARAVYKMRSRTAEFPNAWIKEKLGLRQFRTRGIAKTFQETLWAALTYNIQQWIRLSWSPNPALSAG